MPKKTILIIGAGVAGIASAIHLARRGMHVTVIEKNDQPGGRCDRFQHAGHTFDAGPTLLVMPHLYEAEFEALGSSFQQALDLQRVDPTYHLVFDDGSQLSLTSDLADLSTQLEAMEPGSSTGLLRYLDEGSRHYRLGIERLVQKDFRRAIDFFTLRNLPLLWQVHPLANHYRRMGKYFASPRLKTAFTFQDVYMGLSPFEAPATFSMMPFSELAHGVYYPKGGMYRIVEALVAMAQSVGVEFNYNTGVERIEIQDGRAQGVRLEDGTLINADTVLANADLPYVYQNLLPDRNLGKKFIKKRFSCSVISFFWGVDRIYDQLNAHTLFLADDYRENFKSIIQDLTLPDNPSLYIHAPTRLDPTMAPPGEDTLIAIVPVGHISEDGDWWLDKSSKRKDNDGNDIAPDEPREWVEMRDRARQAVMQRLALLGIHDLESHIKFEVNFTPLSWRKRYNLVKGATHGLSHNLTQLGYFRPKNRHPHYPNVYFTGASTHPGTGIPTALVSARLTAERIIDEMG